jgi:cytidyltransferase-like protein
MKTIVLVTGGFDPVHSGHLQYLEAARKLGDILVVGVNSDPWLSRKKGRAFMPLRERMAILQAMKVVDFVISFDDRDNSARNAIVMTRQSYPQDRIIFANGGDRDQTNIPEMDVIDPDLEFRFGVGGSDKANSSSWILEHWRTPVTRRTWGHYRVLHDVPGLKVKELVVEPGGSLSMQRHQQRSEFWIVSSGRATVNGLDHHNQPQLIGNFDQHQHLHIATLQWHQLVNNEPTPLKIVEIQYGVDCQEQDIERYSP